MVLENKYRKYYYSQKKKKKKKNKVPVEKSSVSDYVLHRLGMEETKDI